MDHFAHRLKIAVSHSVTKRLGIREVVRWEGLRIGVQMIAQRLGRSITDTAIEQLFDESLIDELEKEGFLRASE
jgi:hypothetical protein